MRKYTPEPISAITSLAENQVFVFGSNAGGFHGAGAAGLAFRGEPANTWREDAFFLAAKDAPVGAPERVGRWAIYGIARGLMRGRDGQSYGIVTIERPGLKRSTSLEEIAKQVDDFVLFARSRPELEFLVTKLGCVNAGYTVADVRGIFEDAERRLGFPQNVILPREFDLRPS